MRRCYLFIEGKDAFWGFCVVSSAGMVSWIFASEIFFQLQVWLFLQNFFDFIENIFFLLSLFTFLVSYLFWADILNFRIPVRFLVSRLISKHALESMVRNSVLAFPLANGEIREYGFVSVFYSANIFASSVF